MHVNSDFSLRAVMPSDRQHWVASPQAGVERLMLDRVGGEVARATSLVRYAGDSNFPGHQHAGGEEILVLAGTFSDESGDYPAGWYLRNPPGSSHRPSSAPGALIFVKLRQMHPDDRAVVRLDTRDAANWKRQGEREVCELNADSHERATLERWPAHAALSFDGAAGAELFVVEGEVRLEGDRLARGSWLRLPPHDPARMMASEEGATVYLKTGHLAAMGSRS